LHTYFRSELRRKHKLISHTRDWLDWPLTGTKNKQIWWLNIHKRATMNLNWRATHILPKALKTGFLIISTLLIKKISKLSRWFKWSSIFVTRKTAQHLPKR